MPARCTEYERSAGGCAGGSVAASEIDWRSLQSLVLRETGWTVAQYRQQPMGDVFDLIEHINEEPPAWRILGWLHLKKKPSRSRLANPAPVNQSDVKELVAALGVAPQPVPSHIRADFQWAQGELARRKKK